MKIGGEFLADEWPALRARLEAGDAEAWQLAVEILRSRLCGRYLDHSRLLLDRPYSGFAVLAIDCAVVEALEQFRRGVRDTPWNKGKEFFRAFLTTTRFKNHFSEQTANLFYDTVRCGILHQAETKEDSLVKRKKESFVVRQSSSGRGLIINARRFHEELELTFHDYGTALLQDQPGLRSCFISKMSHVTRSQPGVEGVI